nr:hypothetical protein [Tanacetum cinerariifolium]
MATTIEQQVALDEALVPSTKRLRIGRSNFRLPLDIQSKESTLQVVYDVLRRSSFFKAFLVTADVPEIYMQEFWATAYVHQHSIRFKMDTRKNIVYAGEGGGVMGEVVGEVERGWEVDEMWYGSWREFWLRNNSIQTWGKKYCYSFGVFTKLVPGLTGD